jgi:hypothetical protein
MVHINELPEELLIHIFLVGCEDELNSGDTDYLHPRRMKEFAALSRAVCSFWRRLLDLPSASKHFWIARLRLRFSAEGHGSPLVRELTNFRNVLTNSQGCDLIVNLTAGSVLISGDDIENLNEEDSLRVRLYLHGMSFLKPFWMQIVCLCISVSQPQIDKCYLELLFDMGSRSSLDGIDLSHFQRCEQDGDGSQVRRPRDILKHAAAPGFDSLTKCKCDTSLRETQNLHTLGIDHPLRIDELQLPSSIRRLTVMNLNRHYPFYALVKALIAKPELGNTLTSLFILYHGAAPSGERFQDNLEQPQFTRHQVILHNLHFLYLSGSPADVKSLLHLISFPHLENVILSLQDFDDPSISSPAFDLIPYKLKNLQSLGTDITNSLDSISILEYFVKGQVNAGQIETLNLSWNCTDKGLGREVANLFTDCLSTLHPNTLMINIFLYITAIPIPIDLRGLNLKNIESMQVGTNSTGAFINGKNYFDQPLIFPRLGELSLRGMVPRRILSTLGDLVADALQKLVVDFGAFNEDEIKEFNTRGLVDKPEDWQVPSNNNLKRLPSVQDLLCTYVPPSISSPSLDFLWNTVPNAKSVTVDFDCDWSNIDRRRGGISSIVPSRYLKLLCKSLQPTTDEIPLAQLEHLEVSFPVTGTGMRDYRQMLLDLLNSRTAAGARAMEFLGTRARRVPEWWTKTGGQPLDSRYKLVKFHVGIKSS